MDSNNPLSLLLSGLQRLDVVPTHVLNDVLRRPEAKGTDAKPLGRWLFQQGYLTRYQLNQLATGRDDDLVIGPYMLLEKIAEGGGGQVFKARHTVMNRIVALKRIRPEMLDQPELVRRFFQEVQVAAQLDHPNVVRAFDAGQSGPSYYLAMEYVDGIDLTRLVREAGPLGVAQACEFIRQTALGLQHAHERGLIHRDIKPSNLLVTPIQRIANGVPSAPRDAVIKLLDLGLARWQTDPMTGNGRGLGTPQFVAPEQARSGDAADIRSDLYSVGCTFYFLLTGRPPFEGNRQEILQQHLHQEPQRVETVRPGVPIAIADVVQRLLQKSPGDRFATPKDLAATMITVSKGLKPEQPTKPPSIPPAPPKAAVPAGPIFADESGIDDFADEIATLKSSTSSKPRKSSSGKKTIALAFGIGLHVTALVIVVGVLWWKYGRATDQPEEKVEPRPIAKVTPNPEVPKDIPPLKDAVNKAEKPKVKTPPAKSNERFAKGATPSGKEPIDVARINVPVSKIRTFPDKPPILDPQVESLKGAITCLSLVPEKPIGLLCIDNHLKLFDSKSGKTTGEFPGGPFEAVEANPNGVFAAGIINRQVHVWTLDPAGTPQVLPEGGSTTCLAHSPNGNYLLAGSEDGKARLWDLSKREVDRTLEVGGPISAVAIANNGWLAIVGTERGQIVFFDLESQSKLGSAHRHQEAIRAISVSPDDQLIATVGEDRKILTWSARDGQPRDFMPLDQPLHSVALIGNDWGMAGSRGGRMYAFHLPTRNAVAYGDDTIGIFQALAVSADHRYVYAAFSKTGLGRIDFDPQVVVVAPPQPKSNPSPPPPPPKPPVTDVWKDARLIVDHSLTKAGQVQRIRFSPDGQSLAASGSDGSVMVFSANVSAAPVVIADAGDPQLPCLWIANKLVTPTGFIQPKEKTVTKHVTPQRVSAISTNGTTANDQVLLGLQNGSLYRIKPSIPLYNTFWPVLDKPIIATALSKDGKLALAATSEKVFVCPLDRAEASPAEIATVQGRVRLLTLLPGIELRGVFVEEKSILQFGVQNGKPVGARSIRSPDSSAIRAAVTTPTGTHLVLCISEKVFLMDTASGDVIGRIALPTYTVVHGLDISPDGKRLAIAADKQVMVWELTESAFP